MVTINLRKLTPDDADVLTEMYRRSEISKKNYLIKLSDSENSFKNSGGMFLVNDRKRNMEILSSEEDVVIGGECDGVLRGVIWFNLKDNKYPFDEIEYTEETIRYKEIIARALEENKIFVGKEIIVLPEAKGILVYPLFCELMQQAYNAGMIYKTGEVYRIDGFEDETGFHATELLNLRSFHSLIKTGGIQIGHSPQKKIVKENITYYITPLVFLWNVEQSLYILKKKINEKVGIQYELEKH